MSKETATPALAAPLLDHATSLEASATALHDRMQRQGDVEVLSARKATLQQLVTRLEVLACTKTLLAASDGASTFSGVEAALKRSALESNRLLVSATRIEHEVTTNPPALLKQKALDGLAGDRAKDDRLKQLEAAMSAAWQAFVGTTEITAPERVLGSYAALNKASETLATIREELGSLRESLPSNAAALERALELRRERTVQLESLKGAGLDDELVSFLARSIEGVPLRELLGSPKLLDWLQTHDVVDEFLVRASSTGGKQ